jgi:hypothetical protein
MSLRWYVVSGQFNYTKNRVFHAILLPVFIEFSRGIGTYSSAKFEYIIHKALDYSKKYELQLENVLKMINVEKIRFSENSNMQAIITEYCSDEIINEYYTYMMKNLMLQECDKENLKDKVANYIYETRCKIAHYKYGQEKVKDKQTLGESIIILSKVVKNIYDQLDDKLVEINEKLEVWNKIILK